MVVYQQITHFTMMEMLLQETMTEFGLMVIEISLACALIRTMEVSMHLKMVIISGMRSISLLQVKIMDGLPAKGITDIIQQLLRVIFPI